MNRSNLRLLQHHPFPRVSTALRSSARRVRASLRASACLRTGELNVQQTASGLPLYVLDSAEFLTALASNISLAEFISPSREVKNSMQELCLEDGSKVTVWLGKKPRSLPDDVRYDAKGLALYEELTMQPEYYPGPSEREILNTQMDAISEYIPDGAAIVELGCGAMTKTTVILDYLRSEAGRNGIRFYALDIDRTFLEESLENLKRDEDQKNVPQEHAVMYAGIHGSYEQGVSFLQEIPAPRVLLWLGTSMGNMTPEQAADLLRKYSEAMNVGDKIFVGIDKKKDPKIVVKAYNDANGVGYAIGMNSLIHLNDIIGSEVFDTEHFVRWVGYNEELGRMERYVKSTKDQTVTIPAPFSGFEDKSVDVELKKDEYILYSYCVKYSVEDLENLAGASNLALERVFTDEKGLFYLSLFTKTEPN